MAKNKYDYVLAVDFTDFSDIDKRQRSYKRILRKLAREAAYAGAQENYEDIDAHREVSCKTIADRIAKEMVP